MNKKHYFYTCLLLLAGASAVLWGCLRDTDHNPGEAAGQQAQFSVAEAREFFETISQSITIQGISQNDSNGVKVIPLWELGKSFLSDDVATVETSLNITPFYSWVDGSYDLMTHGKILINTVMVLVAQKDGNGEISFRVVKFIADDDYMKDRPRKFISSPLSVLPDFSGKVIYYDLEGNPLEGTVYESGHRTGELFPAVGKTETTLRGEDPDENHHYECFTIQWKDPTRNGGVLPEVVIVGEPAPFSSSICYYDYQGSDGWGSGGGGGGGSGWASGGNSGIDSGYSKGEISIQLSQTTMAMGTDYTITSTVDSAFKVVYISYIIIDKATNKEYILESTSQKTLRTRAYRPGNYGIKAFVYFEGKPNVYSNEVSMTVEFLHHTDILASQTVKDKMDHEWMLSKISDGNGKYAERGCAIFFNTASNTYSFGPQAALDWRDPCKSALMQTNIEILWTDHGDPRQGSKYFVATFHTHPPYLCGKGDRPVGPSGMDKSNLGSYVNFVYDYVGDGVNILGTHGINDPAKVYHFGAVRGNY